MSKYLARTSIVLLCFLMLCAQFPSALGVKKVHAETETETEVDTEAQSLLYDFEDGSTQGWVGRGGVEVLTAVEQAAYEGDYGLLVEGRTQGWNGPLRDVAGFMEQGKTYEVSAWVSLPEGQPTANVSLLVQRLTDSVPYYEYITARSASVGNWVKITGQYTLAHPAEQLSIYFEAFDEPTLSFYVDQVELKQIPDPEPIEIEEDIPALKDVFANDFILGSSLLVEEIEDADGPGAQLLTKHFNSLTAGNELKWDATEPQEGQFTFARADKIVDFAIENNIPVRGHTLIWHSQTPDWVFYDDNNQLVSKEVLYERMEHHIKTVMERYKGKIYAWDVVNEVIEPGDGQPGGLRNSLWYQIAGEEYIEKAFQWAHEADPDAILYINDYNTHQTVKRQNIYDLIKRLQDKGIPVHGVGHQTHISIQSPSLTELDEMIEAFRDLGIEQQVTELDMSIYTNDNQSYEEFPLDLQIKQAHRYRDIFDIFKKHSDQLTAVIFWGKDDLNTWLRTFPVARNNWPLLFDERLQAKYAYWGLVDPSKLPLDPKAVNASMATAEIDEVKESRWNLSRSVDITNGEEVHGSFATLWDEEHLYIIVEANDDTINENDDVTVFVDRNNDKSNSVQSDDEILVLTRGEQVDSNTVTVSSTETEYGYRLEIAIPLEGNVIDRQIGLDIRLSDVSEEGTIQASWNDEFHMQDEDPSRFGTVSLVEGPRIGNAVYGAPSIDGAIDETWDDAIEIITDRYVEGSEGSIAYVKTLWDEQYLYVLAKVQDQSLSKRSANVWEQDSIEIFIDQNNAKSTSYQADDGQYRINFDNEQSVSPATLAENLTSATTLTDDGYIVEAAIAWNNQAPGEGDVIGFDVQVNNDNNDDGVRDTVAIWNDVTGNSWADPSGFGLLSLLPEETDEEQPPTPTPSPSPRPSHDPQPQEEEKVITYTEASFRELLNQAQNDELRLPIADTHTRNWTMELTVAQINQAREAGIIALVISSHLGNIELPFTAFDSVKQGVGISLALAKLASDAKQEAISIGITIDHRKLSALPNNESIVLQYPYDVPAGDAQSGLLVYKVHEDGTRSLVQHALYFTSSKGIQLITERLGVFAVVAHEYHFTDLAQTLWAQEAIEALAARNLMTGVSDTVFGPNRVVTREQFIEMLIGVLGAKGLPQAEDKQYFNDVTSGSSYAAAITTAVELGIIKGNTDGSFGVGAPLTRQDMVVMLHRAIISQELVLPSALQPAPFADNNAIAPYAMEAAAALQQAGYIRGNQRQEFNPQQSATMAEGAQLLYVLLRTILSQ